MIKLRDYQKECVDTLNSVESGSHLISLATGLGKTVIFSSLQRQGRTLILSHRDELVRQPEKYYDCSYGIKKQISPLMVRKLCLQAYNHFPRIRD